MLISNYVGVGYTQKDPVSGTPSVLLLPDSWGYDTSYDLPHPGEMTSFLRGRGYHRSLWTQRRVLTPTRTPHLRWGRWTDLCVRTTTVHVGFGIRVHT